MLYCNGGGDNVLVGDGEAKITATSKGPFTKVDLGIVKYNFEAVSGRKVK